MQYKIHIYYVHSHLFKLQFYIIYGLKSANDTDNNNFNFNNYRKTNVFNKISIL